MSQLLREIAEIGAGQGAPQGDSSYCTDGIPFVKAGNMESLTSGGSLNDIQKVAEDVAKAHKLKLYPKGTILFAKSGMSCLKGYVYVLPQEAYVVSHLACITPKEDISEYLRYYFAYHKPNQLVKDAAYPSISLTDIGALEIDLKDKDARKHIISSLQAVEGIIKLRNKELQHLDELTKARFVEMFDLEICEWGTYGNDTDFVDYRGHTPELSDGGTIRMVNAKSVGKGFFKYIDEYVTEDVYDSWMHRGFGHPGDVLFVTEGHTFGNTCLIPDGLKKFALGQRVITIKGHKKRLVNEFIFAYMQTDRFWKDINVYRTGGTAQGIRSKDLAKVGIPLPSLDLQRTFAAFVHQVDKSKVAIQKSLKETQLLFDSLMQDYFG